MQVQRKVQLVAAAVLLNALVALSALTPRVAHATTCNPVSSCDFCPTSLATCNLYAPAGCTATSYTCVTGKLCGGAPYGVCDYQPT
jgi:hypothetical protein